MKVTSIKFVLGAAIVCILVVGAYYFFSSTDVKNQMTEQFEKPRPQEPVVEIGGAVLKSDELTYLTEKSLKLMIKIVGLDTGASVEYVYLDGLDLLADDFFLSKQNVEKKNGGLLINLPFLLKPGLHTISVAYKNDRVLRSVEYSFSLGFTEAFEKSIVDSDFFIIPNTTKQNRAESWYVQNGKLTIDKGGFASLAFLYKYSDISVSFEFTPRESPLNLAFYFLESDRTIVIGNGSASRMTLLRSGTESEPAVNEYFELIPNETYSAKIVRTSGKYELFLEKGLLVNAEFPEPTLSFQDQQNKTPDSIGFSIWNGSGGVYIDNLSVVPLGI